MSQKSISSFPMDQTRGGSWKEPLKAPRMDEAERKDHLEEQSREKPVMHLPPSSAAGSPSKAFCGILPVPPALCQGPARHWEGDVEHPVPTCCSLDESEEVLHAFAPTDAPLQQPLVSILPVQELCCGTEHTNGTRGCLPDPKETLQFPP